MECDNNGKNAAATPVSHPILANVTLVGNNAQSGADNGVLLRAGTEVELYNAIITGKKQCIAVETPETENSFSKAQQPSKLEYVSMSSELHSEEGIYTNDRFVAAEGNVTDYTNVLTSNYVGTIEGGKTLADSFFTPATIKEPFRLMTIGRQVGRCGSRTD